MKTYINVYYLKAKLSRVGKEFKKVFEKYPVKSIECSDIDQAENNMSTVKKDMGFRPYLTSRSYNNIDDNGYYAFIEDSPVAD